MFLFPSVIVRFLPTSVLLVNIVLVVKRSAETTNVTLAQTVLVEQLQLLEVSPVQTVLDAAQESTTAVVLVHPVLLANITEPLELHLHHRVISAPQENSLLPVLQAVPIVPQENTVP